jgi:hypothetical protein
METDQALAHVFDNVDEHVLPALVPWLLLLRPLPADVPPMQLPDDDHDPLSMINHTKNYQFSCFTIC